MYSSLKVAFCIPTYNRNAMVAEFLEQSASLFHDLSIDIYYYDSSEDNETEAVVKKWMDIFNNIYYIRIPSDWHANRKVMYIYEEYARNQAYDYIWVCGDSLRYSEKILKQVATVFHLGYDMVIINGIDEGRIGTREYTAGNELFHDCAWHMTLFGAVILNVHTTLSHVPWPYIEEKYEIPERINYSHIGLYFEAIYSMDKFRAFYLAVDQEVWGSQLKMRAGWYQDAFKVLCEYWPSTVKALPEYYTNKEAAMNKLGYYSCLKIWDFLNYRLENVYNIQVFKKYRKVLIGMSRFNTVQLWSLAYLNPKWAFYIVTKDFRGYVKEIQKIRRLHIFCRKFRTIYIYGAGIVAERYAKYFQRKKIIFQGFLITQKGKNPEEFQNHPVISLCEFKSSYDGIGVIIGLNQYNMEEVRPMLMERGLWEHSFHECIMRAMLE